MKDSVLSLLGITPILCFIFVFGLYLFVVLTLGTDKKTAKVHEKSSFKVIIPSKEKMKSAVKIGLIFEVIVAFMGLGFNK